MALETEPLCSRDVQSLAVMTALRFPLPCGSPMHTMPVTLTANLPSGYCLASTYNKERETQSAGRYHRTLMQASCLKPDLSDITVHPSGLPTNWPPLSELFALYLYLPYSLDLWAIRRSLLVPPLAVLGSHSGVTSFFFFFFRILFE